MLAWLLLGGVGVLVVVLVIAFLAMRRGTVYVVGNFGFTAYTASEKQIRQADEAGLRKVVARFLVGDIFDMLWVSTIKDLYSGLTLGLYEGTPNLNVYFNTEKDQQEISAFREAMSHFGFELNEDSDGFSGDPGKGHQVTTLEYTLPKDPDKIVTFIQAALLQLHGERTNGFYMTASLFAHGPGTSKGVKFRVTQEPLDEVL